MARKKFKDTTIGKILIGAAGVISPPLGRLIEGSGTIGEALQYVRTSDIPQEEKGKLEALYVSQQIKEDEEITKRWESDNNAGALTRYIRPVICGTLTLLMLLFTLLESSGMFDFQVADKWVSFWSTAYIVVIGSYFGSKGMEKTFNKNK